MRWLCCLLLPCLALVAVEPSQLVRDLAAGKNPTVVVYGSSLTLNGTWPKRMKEWLDAAYPGRINLINAAQIGQDSTWGLQQIQERVIAKKPDALFIEFGASDALPRFKLTTVQARRNVDGMLAKIKAALPECEVFLMTMTATSGKADEERSHNLNAFYQVYRDAGSANELRIVDNYPTWKTLLEKSPDVYAAWVPDGLNPGDLGAVHIILPNLQETLTGTRPKPVNMPPVVAFTAPANNSTLATGSDVALAAMAADADGAIVKVEFAANSEKIGEATASPYAMTWKKIPAGTYSLQAKATDDAGASTLTIINLVVK